MLGAAAAALLAARRAVRQALVVAPEGHVAELRRAGRCAAAPVRVLALHGRALRAWCEGRQGCHAATASSVPAPLPPPLRYTDAEYVAVVRERLRGRATHFVCVVPRCTAAGVPRTLPGGRVLCALACHAPCGGLVLLEPAPPGSARPALAAFARAAEAAAAVATRAAQLGTALGAVVTLGAPPALLLPDGDGECAPGGTAVVVHNVTAAAAAVLLPRVAAPPLAGTVAARTPGTLLRPPAGAAVPCETLVVVFPSARLAAQFLADTHDCLLADTCLRCEVLPRPPKPEPEPDVV